MLKLLQAGNLLCAGVFIIRAGFPSPLLRSTHMYNMRARKFHTFGSLDPLQHPRLAAKLRKRLDVESRSVPQAELEPRRRDAEETDLGEGPESDEVLTKSWRVLQDFSNAKLQRSKVRVFIFFDRCFLCGFPLEFPASFQLGCPDGQGIWTANWFKNCDRGDKYLGH